MKKEIEIKKKKPRLVYDGMEKKTLSEAVPTQVIEVVYPSKADKKDENTLFSKGELQQKVKKSKIFPKNRLIWTSDNLVALKTLLDEKDSVTGEYKYRNKIDLIYIDPPFMVQDDFVAQNSIDIELDKEERIVSVKEPTIIETIAYKDTWQNGLDSFLQMIKERLQLMKELLSPTGSIFVHLDWHVSHYVKVLMDEIFDYSLFRNEIIWHYYNKYSAAKKAIPRAHDSILLYSKTENNFLKEIRELRTEPVKQLVRENVDGVLKNARDNQGNLVYREAIDKKIDDVWRIPALQHASEEWTGFPTQKHPNLLNRIIAASCPSGGVVLDAFVGSGTTVVEAEKLFSELNCSWIGIDNSKFAIHTARKRLIELSGKVKGKKGEGVYKVRPFTVENMGYYQRGLKWDAIQTSQQADTCRQAIIELFGGEYLPYSKLLHGKKRGNWIHVGPLSQPLIADQILAIAEEVQETEFSKCYVLSADFTAHLNKAVEIAKEKFKVQIITRIIPASAIEEVKKRLELIKQGVRETEHINDMPNLAFFAPLTVNINKVVDGKEVMVELAGVEVDVESFLESQKPGRKEELKKWLEKEKSWQSFVDFWAIDWDYKNLNSQVEEPVFENEWQSFRKRKGKKVFEDLVFKAFKTYDNSGEYTIAVKVTDVFGNDGIVTAKIVIKN